MSNKTRSMIKWISVIIVVLCVIMHLQLIIIPAIIAYKTWLLVAAYVMLLLTSK